MNEFFPPLLDFASLPRRALVLAPHPDDEVFGCGGAIALHAARGDAVRIVVLTDGAQGSADESARGPLLAVERSEESRLAAADLGISDLRWLALGDGKLGGCFDLAQRVLHEIEDFSPELVYAPSPFEHHPDHRAAFSAAVAALSAGPRRRVLLYGVNAAVPASALIDTTSVWDKKRAAIRRFRTQVDGTGLEAKAEAADRARTVNVDDPAVHAAEGFGDLSSAHLVELRARAQALLHCLRPDLWPEHSQAELGHGGPSVTAVISTWNKCADLRDNLLAVRAQTRAFDEVIVVDNCSRDGTAEMVRAEFPEVRLIVMPHSSYGACETFNVGFASTRTPLLAILDDDIVLPPEWLEKTWARLMAEPVTTAVVSTKVVEPGTPESYLEAPEVNRERYMSTFRGCASLARTRALREAGYYDERLYIYGNERDLTCRLLNLGYRVLSYPGVETFHKTPFGIKTGKRSLYFHARNVWLTMLKYAPLGDLVRLPWLVLTRVVFRRRSKEESGAIAVATGTIGIGRSLRETRGGAWIVTRALLSVLCNVPYCLRRRAPVRSEDFELPLS